MPKNIHELLRKININTRNVDLYKKALTHNSYNNEHRVGYTYQKLEFLGDAVISKIISVWLYWQNKNEQEMTEIRKNLVNTETFRQVSEKLDLLSYSYIGKGLNLSTDTKKIKADLFEALSGAIYLDQGEDILKKFLENTIIKWYFVNSSQVDYKTRVQELLQKNITSKKSKKSHVYYQTEEISKNKFKATLIYDDVIYGTGYGSRKKDAEKQAAKVAYEKFVYPKEPKSQNNKK